MLLTEQVVGWVYLPIHAIGLWIFMPFVVDLFGFNDMQYNMFAYTVGFAVLSLSMSRFLRESFDVFWDNFMASMKAIGVNIILYYVTQYAITLALLLVLPSVENPNTEAVGMAVAINSKVMKFIAVVLAPIVEEILFRGIVFGTIAGKNKTAAYIVSTVLFAAYHLWSYLFAGVDFILILLYSIEYVPGAVFFAKSYDESGNIWTPILMHAVMNYVAIGASSML